MTKQGSEKTFDGFVKSISTESNRGFGQSDLKLIVELDDGRIKKIRGKRYLINKSVKVRCLNTYFFNAERCHIILETNNQ